MALFLTAAPAPTYQFANEFTPVANLTTIPVDSSAAVQGEVISNLLIHGAIGNWILVMTSGAAAARRSANVVTAVQLADSNQIHGA